MTFGQSIVTVFGRYAEFRGRAGRPEFWWWILFTTLVSTALGPAPTWSVELSDGGALHGPTLAGVWTLAVLVPTLAVTVRRLRDAGFAWAHALWLLLPVVGTIVLAVLCAQPSQEASRAAAAAVAPLAVPPPR